MSAEEARRLAGERAAVWFSGHFDPLLAEHARMLRGAAQAGRLLIVEVTDPVEPLLSNRARAELVAALESVDQVVMSPVASPAPDSALSERFVDHVRSRANGVKA